MADGRSSDIEELQQLLEEIRDEIQSPLLRSRISRAGPTGRHASQGFGS
jgi:hypothetical protein